MRKKVVTITLSYDTARLLRLLVQDQILELQRKGPNKAPEMDIIRARVIDRAVEISDIIQDNILTYESRYNK